MSPYAVRKLILVASVVAAMAGTASAETTNVDPSWPDWLKEEMVKEHEEMRFEALSLGPIKTVMPGEIEERQEIEPGRFYASADDGSGALVECWFFSDPIDMASSAANIANAIIEATSEQHGPVGFRSVQHVDSGEIDGSAFLALEWLYTVGEAPAALVTLTKVRAANRDGMHVICAHSMPGYRDSFAKGFAELVRQLDSGSEVTDPYYQELYVLALNDLNTGYVKVMMTLDEDGDTRIDATEAMLIPISSTDLATSDSVSVSWSTPDGYLINAMESSAENGESAMNLSLRLDDEGMWVVDGSFRGKEINEQLGKEAAPASALGEMFAVRDLLQEPDAKPVKLVSWIPDADPTVFSDVTVASDPDNDVPGAASITLGPLKVNGEFDDNGSMRRGTMDLGGLLMHFERVFVSGSLR